MKRYDKTHCVYKEMCNCRGCINDVKSSRCFDRSALKFFCDNSWRVL